MRFYKKDSTPKRHSQPDPPPSYESPKRSPTPEDPEKQLSVPEEDTMGTALPQIPSTTITIDPAVERRVLRKLDLRVPTLLGFLYLLAIVDRSNIGNAKIAGMEEDLNLSSDQYAWLLTIFYIPYAVCEFLALMWKIVPFHRWAALTVLAWGIFATCQAAAQNWSGMMALRFLLGLAETAYGPGAIYALSFFYRRHELGLRCGLFVSAAPLANTFAGALAYGITSGHSKLANWRLLFLVEGAPSLIAAVLAWFYLPDHPSTARFLTDEEKEVARARALRQSGEHVVVHNIDWKDVGRTLLDAKAWITALMYFSCNVSFSSLSAFLPTILNEMGFSAINAQGLTAPPYFAALLTTLFTTWLADRIQQRGLVIFFLSILGCVGYVLLATCMSVGVRYLGVFFAAAGVFPCIANILPWVLNNQGSETRRGMGIVILNVVGQCGPFLGSNIYPSSDGPRYILGQSVCAAFMAFNALLAITLRGILMWQNRRLDKKHGPRVDKGDEGELAEENYGSNFRYVL
ncbi:predicted protein [Aspergillus terreus NIH2624]|uniref:Major facilitator superfamily (MFS) profile domain-containing protein n=1 Tax=Aspergillus terreus (strain NIH 2624 / FGSC A1156) TaxID=341663 RepID=Q0CKG1_ASPTN|nr:uncharacterized protein ATEG_05823 [Aspergillus terreus NIH2624]EAU33584.1 predicted protein [Aspergillus terreus NIH2624]